MKKSSRDLVTIENFKTLNCAQSVLLSFTSDLNLDPTTALRIASGFGGGMAMSETCDAVTGACMVLGMKVQTEGKTI